MIPSNFVTLTGLLATMLFAFTHPGHEGFVCTALAAFWGITHGKNGNGGTS